jgi:hypothetical protein
MQLRPLRTLSGQLLLTAAHGGCCWRRLLLLAVRTLPGGEGGFEPAIHCEEHLQQAAAAARHG